MNDSSVYFEGDPETDSARRRMERLLKGEPPQRRWPWMLAALGGGGLWLIWHSGRSAARARDDQPGEAQPAERDQRAEGPTRRSWPRPTASRLR